MKTGTGAVRRIRHVQTGAIAQQLARLAGAVVLLSVGGCVWILADHNAFQTGKVLPSGAVRASATTIGLYYPVHGSVRRRPGPRLGGRHRVRTDARLGLVRRPQPHP